MGDSAYDEELMSTLDDWESAVQAEETILMQLRKLAGPLSVVEPSTDPAHRLHQLRVVQSALESLNAADPRLPIPSSPLPALLALHTAQRVSHDTAKSTETLRDQVQSTRAQLEREQADLHDGHLITAGLERRIERLREEDLQLAHIPPGQAVADLIQRLRQRRKSYDREVNRLINAFNDFIKDHLATMLAAEEAGGPIVGQLLDVDPDAFVTKRGKRNAARDDDEDADPVSAAGSELRELTEELMNASVAAEGNSAQAYVTLQRESAAARFLVRAKIAQFAPRDARRIRLIDFGKRLDE
ncbi:MAG: hypothetical protein M1823_000372 [Watsoniomyces obsoletus]|nr:MAG: hypothetical protein M1823_000372 [Watsoniomyces obsoletus]